MVAKGRVKWFNEKKGYGFISRDDGNNIFVHFSAIKRDGVKTLYEGNEVEFEVSQGPKGLQATSVVSWTKNGNSLNSTERRPQIMFFGSLPIKVVVHTQEAPALLEDF